MVMVIMMVVPLVTLMSTAKVVMAMSVSEFKRGVTEEREKQMQL